MKFLIQKAQEVGGGDFLTGGKFKHGALYWDYSNKRVNSVITSKISSSKITTKGHDPNKNIGFNSFSNTWFLRPGPNWYTVCQY